MKRAVFRTATMIIASASNSRRTSVIRHHKFHIFLIISNAKSVNINQICVQPSTSTTDRSDTAGIKTQNRKYTVNHSSGTVGAESGSSSQKMRHGENSLSHVILSILFAYDTEAQSRLWFSWYFHWFGFQCSRSALFAPDHLWKHWLGYRPRGECRRRGNARINSFNIWITWDGFILGLYENNLHIPAYCMIYFIRQLVQNNLVHQINIVN